MSVSPEDSFGGILADDMGLGKSLSMISAIVTSKNRALKFACFHELGTQPVVKQFIASKTTLIIVPSALLIDGWIDEIRKHTALGTLYFHKYHGQDKLVDISTLLENDIVITTYATLAMEHTNGHNEAHVIRNPSTKQFQAAHTVPAYIRWCLTGTPIQNTLEDLGALVKFLRVPVLGDAPMFRKHILASTSSKSANRLANLRHLLAAVCLRRTRTVLPLLEPAENIVPLDFSSAETERYKDFETICRRAIDKAISGHNVKKAHQCVLEAILRLRLFCNHGLTEAMGSEFPQGFPSDLENAYSILQTQNVTTCAYCSNDVSFISNGHDLTPPALTGCHHLLCENCVPKYRKAPEAIQNKSSIKECPVCHFRYQNEVFIPLGSSPRTVAVEGRPHPTKLLAIVDNIIQHIQQDKSIIFSFWRKTLDRLAHILQMRGISFLRVDGSVPLSKRGHILSEFHRNPEMKVLLITFGTGAVGLNNLSVANRVHIVEPQWNPAVESQAIARILRLGQSRAVTVLRYIMNKSVEQSVQSRQLRKLQLAHGGFRYDNSEEANQKVRQVMDLLFPTQNTCDAKAVLDFHETGQSPMDLD
ncbi:hypothetical protein AOQ84DRAFT_369386 [Glonium stellatum]|uniref:Uncharacterized protein n=1 Tax=Glonium stellatum TaxID=574774 RepID=A0A8E2JM77_9PEZI|nr:hypothetical protein AOQ84DRAFT_369386 [Glonium stellatum]